MNAQARLNALDAAGQALAALGEGDVTLRYSPTAHPGVRFGVLLHGPYGAPYVASGPTPRKAFVLAAEKRANAGKVAA